MTHIKTRRDTAANWAIANPVLQLGEQGLERDTRLLKFGDGSTAWNALPYSDLDDGFVVGRVLDNWETQGSELPWVIAGSVYMKAQRVVLGTPESGGFPPSNPDPFFGNNALRLTHTFYDSAVDFIGTPQAWRALARHGHTVRWYVRPYFLHSGGATGNPTFRFTGVIRKFPNPDIIGDDVTIVGALSTWTEIEVSTDNGLYLNDVDGNGGIYSLDVEIDWTRAAGQSEIGFDIAAVVQGNYDDTLRGAATATNRVANKIVQGDTASKVRSDALNATQRNLTTLTRNSGRYLVPGPGSYLINLVGGFASTEAIAFANPHDPPGQNTSTEVELWLKQDATPVQDVSFPQSLVIPGQPLGGDISIAPIANSLTYLRARWMGYDFGWVVTDFQTGIAPVAEDLPATGTGGSVLFPAKVMRGFPPSARQGISDAITSYVPVAARTGLAGANARGYALYAGLNWLDVSGIRWSPNDAKQTGWVQSIGGLYVTGSNWSMIGNGSNMDTTTHEIAHAIDFNWCRIQTPSTGITNGVTKISDHATFTALYAACVADGTINHSQYGFTNILEFFAEVVSAHFRSEGGDATGTTKRNGYITSGRVAALDAFLTTFGL